MKKLIYLSAIVLLFTACAEEEKKEIQEEVITSTKVKYKAPAYAKDEVTSIAKTITYPVVIKNPDKTDEWTEDCLKEIDIKAYSAIFFNLIYTGKVKAFPYMSDEKMTIEEVKAFEKEFSRDRIAKVLFEEEWVFDEVNAKMHKKVNSIMLAYELYSENGDVKGYKAGIQIFLK